MIKLISFIFILGLTVLVLSLSTIMALIMNVLRRMIGKKSKSKCINDYIRRR